MIIVILPGLTFRVRLGMISWAPMMEIGTMGTPALMARWNMPCLNGLIVPSLLRVPSGKVQTDLPSRIFRAASSRLFMAFS